MKKKIVFVLLSIFCFLSLIGTGFSYWIFNRNSRQDIAIHVYVTESSLAGKFSTPGMPVFAVLDEGMSRINSTITGVSFYKSGEKNINGIGPIREEKVVDSDLTITFKTSRKMSIEEVTELQFGLRLSTTGKLSNYLRKTTYYSQMDVQTKAPKDGKGDYIDLRALSSIPKYDGSLNFSCEQEADGTWLLTFQFTTIMLNSFYTYQEGKCPDTKKKYDTLVQDFSTLTEEDKTSFVLELWQGW